MDFDLICHPDSPRPPLDSIRVKVERRADARMLFRYVMIGEIGAIAMPVLMATERADELWKTTCFEAFLKRPDSDRYVEFNFAPSTRWAGYIFNSYRTDMQPFAAAALPRFDMRAGLDSFELSVTLDLSETETARRSVDLALGLSAVIETRDREKSYWALAHPPGKPDFHHGDCFAARLKAPVAE